MKSKINLTIGFVLFNSLFILSFASASSVDCIKSVQEHLSLQKGQELKVLNGVTSEGLACEFSIKYDEANSGLTHQDYRMLEIVPSRVMRYANGELSKMFAAFFADLEDNSNGLNEYSISQCVVTPNMVKVVYSEYQNFGWHKTFNYSFELSTVNGVLKTVTASDSEYNKYNCKFQ